MQNAYVGIRLNDEDGISVNNVVEIVETDIRASNGRIHIINDVLLNRVIDNIVDDLNLSDFIIPNVTAEPTPETTPTPEPTPSNMRSFGHIRFVHASADTTRVTIALDDDEELAELNFGDNSDFAPLPQGIYNMTIRNSVGVLVGFVEVTLLADDFTTIVLISSEEANAVATLSIEEDFSGLSDEAAIALDPRPCSRR